MKAWKPSCRTSLATLILSFALLGPAPVARAQATNPCLKAGVPKNGVLQAQLNGNLAKGNQLELKAAGVIEWSQSDPELGLILDSNLITVPAGKVAFISINIKSSSPPTKIRFYTDLSTEYQPVAPSLLAMVDGQTIKFCDDNSAGSTRHTWNFGVMVGKDWWDPQIQNDGSSSPWTRRSDRPILR